ncbi:MAG: hypothetical protein RR821_14560, partial [Clostridia bacterium]
AHGGHAHHIIQLLPILFRLTNTIVRGLNVTSKLQNIKHVGLEPTKVIVATFFSTLVSCLLIQFHLFYLISGFHG